MDEEDVVHTHTHTHTQWAIRQRQILYVNTYICHLKKINEYGQIRNRCREQTTGYQWGEGKGLGDYETNCYIANK